MGDDDHGSAFFRQFTHDLQHFSNQFGIKGRGRFVKQDYFRLHGESPGDGGTLLLTA